MFSGFAPTLLDGGTLGQDVFILLGFIVWFGFRDRSDGQVISAFDLHALVMVLVGSCAAVLVSSSRTTALHTLRWIGWLGASEEGVVSRP